MSAAKQLKSSGSSIKQIYDRKNLKYQIGIQCAPVLVGIKTANMVSIPTNCLHYILELLEDTGVIVIRLYERKAVKKSVLLLYRQELLKIQLKKKEVIQFLLPFGYSGKMNFEQILYWLVHRFQNYAHNNGEFPHEVGVFLEYPLDDMKSFLFHKGKNCLMAGYWKVYHNERNSKYIFDKYDMAKDIVIGCLSQNLLFYEIISVYQSLYKRSSQISDSEYQKKASGP